MTKPDDGVPGDDSITGQERRSRSTRRKILESAVQCLATKGWNASTVGVIADAAGTSRGALQHHFPTREDLVLASLDYMFDQRVRQVDEELGRFVEDEGREEHVVGLLLDYYSGTLFKAALQVWTVAGADEELRKHVLPLERKFARAVHDLAVRLLRADDSDPDTHRMIQATLDLARGLGLADVLADDSARRAKIAAVWAVQLRGIKSLPA